MAKARPDSGELHQQNKDIQLTAMKNYSILYAISWKLYESQVYFIKKQRTPVLSKNTISTSKHYKRTLKT